ncbi:MAG: SRPBCC domain-containing protein [Bacteroidetes Order II. Incertae sedis bacterium]|nr:SRPBCC domain-containing protein [Bacteroidetes Order II. bacterium]
MNQSATGTLFMIDIQKGSLEISRIFAANRTLVWRAWTEADLLDQWWAPKPWRCETKHMDFREGGRWIYAMVGPNGERHGAVQRYSEILKEVFFRGEDAFADEEGNINGLLPVATWENVFTDVVEGTLVKTFVQYPNPEALQEVLNMGMEEGLKMAHGNLDEVLGDLVA